MPVSPKARTVGLPARGSPYVHPTTHPLQCEAFSLTHPLTRPRKRCCPLYEMPMSGTSRRRGIWHMNHSQSWGINYSSKRKTKHFTNCPGRKELGRGWEMGQTSGWRPAPFMKRKEGKRKKKKVLSGVIKALLHFWTQGCLFTALPYRTTLLAMVQAPAE